MGGRVGYRVCFVLLGVAGLLFRRHYRGPGEVAVHSYGGNITVSFAVYFLLSHPSFPPRFRRLLAACLALAAVEAFEAMNGFGLMKNTYDPWDFVANAVGVAVAWAADTATGRAGTRA